MEYLKSLVETTKWLNSVGKTYTLISRYSSFVPSAREKTATDSATHDWKTKELGAGKFTYNKVVWIDSDISWNIDTLQRLLESDLDIIGAVMPVNSSGLLGAMKLSENGVPKTLTWTDIMLDGDPIEVDGISFGMLAIKNGVFEKMSRPWFAIKQTPLPDVDFDINYGEDYSFCVNAKNSGFQIWLDPLAKVSHVKEFVLTV